MAHMDEKIQTIRDEVFRESFAISQKYITFFLISPFFINHYYLGSDLDSSLHPFQMQ